jgi:hypothetical protein
MRVLRLLVRGLSNRELGEQLGVSTETVKSHFEQILATLDVASRQGCASRPGELGRRLAGKHTDDAELRSLRVPALPRSVSVRSLSP